MSIAKPFTFVANTYAKASEVNADFDVVYSQVNTNISDIAQNATDIDNLENNKANINGSTSQRFAVADAVSNGDAINKQTMIRSITNILPFISGYIITKDSGSPNDTIIVSEGSCYDSTHTTMLIKTLATTKQNTSQSANTTYYVYVIGNSTGASVDILISASSDNPGLPTGYSLYRQIGYYTTDGDGNIKSIYYYGSDPSGVNDISKYTPDYSAGVTASIYDAQGYTPPTAGVLLIGGYAGSQNAGASYYATLYIYKNGVEVASKAFGGANVVTNDGICIPVNNKFSYRVIGGMNGGSTLSGTFFPLEGAV